MNLPCTEVLLLRVALEIIGSDKTVTTDILQLYRMSSLFDEKSNNFVCL